MTKGTTGSLACAVHEELDRYQISAHIHDMASYSFDMSTMDPAALVVLAEYPLRTAGRHGWLPRYRAHRELEATERAVAECVLAMSQTHRVSAVLVVADSQDGGSERQLNRWHNDLAIRIRYEHSLADLPLPRVTTSGTATAVAIAEWCVRAKDEDPDGQRGSSLTPSTRQMVGQV